MKAAKKTARTKPDAQTIADWKEKHNCKNIIVLKTEDDLVCYLRDPLDDLKVMKLAFTALQKSKFNYVNVIMANCWIEGDEEMKTEPQYVNYLADKIDEITEIPDAQVHKVGDNHILSCEGFSVEVRTAERGDIVFAEQKNAHKEPFETAINLLNRIAVDKNNVSELRKNTRAFIGILTAVNDVKEKVAVTVEKL